MPRRVGIEIAALAAAMGLAFGLLAAGIPCALAIAEQPAPVVQRIYHTSDYACLHGSGCIACNFISDPLEAGQR